MKPFRNYIFACLVLCSVIAGSLSPQSPIVQAQTSRTRIVDRITDAGGNPRQGSVTFVLLTKSATGPSGLVAVKPSVSATVDSSGRFDISVYPSSSISPKAYYNVLFKDASGGQENLGVFDIPTATVISSIAAYKVTDMNLAGPFLLPSVTDLNSLVTNVSTATLAKLNGVTRANNKVQKYSGSSGTFEDTSITDSGSSVTVASPLSVTGNTSITGTFQATSINNTPLNSPTISSPTFSGPLTVNSALTVNSSVTANVFNGSAQGLTNFPTTSVGPTGLASTGAITNNADSDGNASGTIDDSINGVTKRRLNNDGTTDLLGGFVAFTKAGLPSCPCAPGRLARVSDDVHGMFVTDGNAWFPMDATINVRWFGAIGDGGAHPLSDRFGSLAAAQAVYPHATALTQQIDWAAIQGAINAATSGGSVFIPKGTYIVNPLIIEQPLTLRGENMQAMLKPASGATGALLTVAKTGSSTVDQDGFLPYIFINHLSFDGNGRTPSISAIKMQELDHCYLDHLKIENFKYEALDFYSAVRETYVSQILMRWNGDADSGHPGINLNDRSTSTPDATNFIYFSNINSVFSMGDHILLDTVAGKELNGSPVTTRDIFFNNITFHGIVPEHDGLFYTFTTAQKSTRFVVIKAASRVHLIDAPMKIAGIGEPYIHVLAGTHVTPPNGIFLSGVDTQGRYSFTGSQDALRVEAGDVSVSNSNLDGPTNAISASSGALVYTDLSNRYGGAVLIPTRSTLTLPNNLTAKGSLGISSPDSDIQFSLNNTGSGGHQFNLSNGNSGSGNCVGTYLVDSTAGRVLWCADAVNGRFGVRRGLGAGLILPTYGTSIPIDAGLANHFQITVTNTTGFAIANPTNAPTTGSQQIVIEVVNNSGGAMGAVTWGGNYLVAGWTNPANGKRKSVAISFNGGQWVQVGAVSPDL
jgi:hypothetical protein